MAKSKKIKKEVPNNENDYFGEALKELKKVLIFDGSHWVEEVEITFDFDSHEFDGSKWVKK